VRPIRLVALLGAGCGLALTLAATSSARAAELTFQCANSASHALWTLKVDDVQHTADGFPAQITANEISWRDTGNGGIYELDRATGELTFTNSSSMGGYMLYHQCHLQK
jgi:hypothetical protein